MKLRTEVAAPEQASTGKWRSCFNTYGGEVGAEYLMSSCSSAPVWDTEDEAYDGARRALDVLEATDKFPNMCERW